MAGIATIPFDGREVTSPALFENTEEIAALTGGSDVGARPTSRGCRLFNIASDADIVSAASPRQSAGNRAAIFTRRRL